MLTVSGIKNHDERVLIREFCDFMLNRFVSPKKLKNADIIIRSISEYDVPEDQMEEFEEASAWMSYDGKIKGRKKFTIEINNIAISNSRNIKLRMGLFLLYLSHELVHVKQYLNGEMFDYADGERYRFKGKLYRVSSSKKMDWDYYDSPAEIEAYGRAEGIYNMFCEHKWNGRI